jgi:hypothetical protein
MFNFGRKIEKTESPVDIEENKKKEEYLSEVARRDKFLSSQKGANIEGSKNFGNYEEFNKNPSEHLINLYKKDLEKEYELFKKGDLNNTEDFKMHLRNLEMLSRKIALFQEFGKKAEAEMNKEITSPDLGQNKISNFTSIINKNFLDTKFKLLKSKFAEKIKPIKYMALALMFSIQPSVSQGQNKNEIKDSDKNKLEDTRTMETKEAVGQADKTYDMGADFRFTTEDESGNRESNILGGIIAPIALELDINKNTEGNIEANIPLTYAPDFKETELNKEDSVKMKIYFEQQIRKVVENTLIRIAETKGVYRANHEGEDDLLKNEYSNLKITSIKVTGYASPEASTSESVIPGNKEEKNLELAKKRAQIVEDVVKKILEENKVDLSVLDSVNFEEVQFSDNEWNSLTGLADSLGIKGLAQEDQILELVSKYNDGDYNNNPEVKKIMDEVVGNKRGATIEIEYETNKITQIVVPIPLLLLLLLSKRIRRGIFRRRKPKNPEPIKPEPIPEPIPTPVELTKNPREIFSEKDIDEENVISGDFNYYQLYETADKDVEYQDQYLIRKYFIEKELYPYIDDEFSIKQGLDYRSLIEHIYTIRDRYNTEEEIKIEIAKMLLEMWQQYDRNVRQAAGIEINKKTTLDYRHDEKKILWAKIAAPEMLNLARQYNNPDELFVEIEKLIQKNIDNIEKDIKKKEIVNDDEKLIKSVVEEEENDHTKNIPEIIDENEISEINSQETDKISQEEYDGMKDDMKMINRKIQLSEGIVTLEENNFKSEYGRKWYQNLHKIQEGMPVRFNKTELQMIGDVIEGILSKAVVKKEQTELEKATEEERSIFAEFKKFTEENPEEKIPKEMEERYRQAEERLRLAQEKAEI